MNLDSYETLANGLDHPEGIAIGSDGTIYAGGEGGQIYRVADGGFEQVATTGGFLLGLAVDGSGHVYGCDLGRQEVIRWDGDSVESYSRGTAEQPMRTPNFLCFDAQGNLYVTDSGEWNANDGLIYRVARNGETEVWCSEASNFPNGCCLSPDSSTLFVVESLRPGVVAIPIEADGSAGRPEVVAELAGTVPDGVTAGSDGTLYVACYRPDRIYKLDHGQVEVLADDPQGVTLAAPTNIAFAGDRMLIANLGRWHLTSAPAPSKGASLAYPKL